MESLPGTSGTYLDLDCCSAERPHTWPYEFEDGTSHFVRASSSDGSLVLDEDGWWRLAEAKHDEGRIVDGDIDRRVKFDAGAKQLLPIELRWRHFT